MKKNKFWNNKNVFITGINGFVGGNLAKLLLSKGANVYGLIKTYDHTSLIFYSNMAEEITLINGNLVDKELLKTFFIENEIDICYHLAAQVEVGVAAKYPYSTWETNVRGTYSLLEAIRESEKVLSAIVIASTDKAYGEYPPEKMPYKEDYPLLPKFPYDTSKACADLIAQSYSSEVFNMPIVITRFANIYGPGQLNFSALIPDAIYCALGYKKFIPRSDGSSIRDFLFVEDVSSLYALIAESLSKENSDLKGQVFNAGTKKGISVREVIEKIYSKLDKNNLLDKILLAFNKNEETLGEINAQLMDYDKVEEYFGWKPFTEFDHGLNQTIEWYTKYFKKYNY